MDKSFFLSYYSILVFSKLLPITLIMLPNILFIIPIIPSQIQYVVYQINSCYIDSPTNCTMNDDYIVT